tara:strand:+ start:41 stop:376 length:336 start_codon:yes stop_codon:yes gene_type:complete
MDKIKEFINKRKVVILISLVVILSLRNCSKSRELDNMSKEVGINGLLVDSLNSIIEQQGEYIDMFPKVIRDSKIKIHVEYDNYISKKDRGRQLMDLHMVVKENIKRLEKQN